MNDVRIDVNRLHPNLKYKLNKLLKLCNDEKIGIIITEGFRTKEYQDKLYAKGRTAPGNIVTNARGNSYSSQHQWGIAFDIAINNKNYTYNPTMIAEVAKLAKQCKLCWGGDWKSFKDTPHFYLGKWGSTTKELKRLYGTPENFEKTWTAMVTKSNGLKMFTKVDKSKVKMTIPCYEEVRVLYRKLWYARIEYKGMYGYVRKKYLK